MDIQAGVRDGAELSDWQLNFNNYADELGLGPHKATTIRNYLNWLRPYTAYLVRLNRVPDSQVVKFYLDQRYKNRRTYKRVGAQLVKFTNNFLTEKISLIAPTGCDVVENRLQMPEESMQVLLEYFLKVVANDKAPLENRYKNWGK